MYDHCQTYQESHSPTAACLPTLAQADVRVCSTPPTPSIVTKRSWDWLLSMPSTHSASISFYATYITLASFYLPIHSTLARTSPWLRVLAPALALPWGATILASRVWLGHHTWKQVFAGAALGLCFAGMWFEGWMRGANEVGWMVEEAVAPYVRW